MAGTIRRDAGFWLIPLSKFQVFERHQIVEDAVPKSWNLKVGDQVEYELGSNIHGFAEVVDVREKECEIMDPSSDNLEDRVIGVVCSFRKVS